MQSRIAKPASKTEKGQELDARLKLYPQRGLVLVMAGRGK